MNIELIRAPHRAVPFRPFVIHTSSGGAFSVRHPENLSITIDETGVVVMPAGGEVALIDADSVTEVTYDFNRKPTANSGA